MEIKAPADFPVGEDLIRIHWNRRFLRAEKTAFIPEPPLVFS